ncbi:hypothetical protein V6N12_058724 [Hibiscus sabdariffa]|uniref:Uncharacterized protein n=1 Tax=Hibiscus sabdariffa TaxID=183260 RepID=A0ABR2ET31_9ROSI
MKPNSQSNRVAPDPFVKNSMPQLNLVIASMVDVVRFVGPHIVKLLGPEKPGSLHQTRAYRSQLMMPLFPQDDLLTMIINN